MNSNVQAAMPKFAGLSHVCIFVDDMMEAVDYYQKLLGVVPDHYLSHWRNEGFFKAGGFVKEAADGDVSIAFVNVPGTKLTLELMQYHSPEGRKEPIFFAANDVSGARHVALKITNIDEAFLHIKSMPDTRLINETDDYQVFQISETYPDEVHFFDQDMKEMDERKQQTAKILSEVRYFYFIDKYGLQWVILRLCFLQILLQHFLQFFYNATILPNRDSHPQLWHILPHTSVHSNLFFAVFWTAHLLLYFIRNIDHTEPIEHSVDVGHASNIAQCFRAAHHFSFYILQRQQH